jgi:adenine/guanine/hypoxanthine permease
MCGRRRRCANDRADAAGSMGRRGAGSPWSGREIRTGGGTGVLERWFQLRAHGTTPRIEIEAGLATFLTMAYIVVVNPGILADAGVPFEGALFATCMAAALSTLLMGLLANYPFALAPGMGLNAFFAYTVVGSMGIPW